MKQLKLALDWTPNINHIGFFIAQEKGFYADLDLDVTIVSPANDDYQITPAKKVELGDADFAICPTESIISYRTKSSPFPLIAIAAVLQSDLSAIVTKKDVGINSPKDLDGKIYASYEARYEDGIVKELIKNDGGQGDLNITYPKKLGIWDNLLSGEADATWIFTNWEGVEAKKAGIDLNYFHLKDYDIPYSYSPVIAANGDLISEKKAEYSAFLEATKKGFLYCNENPTDAINILKQHLVESDRDFDLASALEETTPHFGNDASWGIIKDNVVSDFMVWLKQRNLEQSGITPAEIFTNECLN
ncbi:MAG: ABC transporter substrate-binding protein [Crocinitomicaceae bacterium]